MSNNIPIPFHDIVNDIFYIDRKTYELCKSLQIEIDGFPRIIQDKNCYSITKDQLQTLSNTLGMKLESIKIILRDDKERIKKTQILKVCKYHDAMFIRDDLYSTYIEKAKRRKIRIDGIIYIHVVEDDLIEIIRTHKSQGIKIKIESFEIAPIKKKEIQFESKITPDNKIIMTHK